MHRKGVPVLVIKKQLRHTDLKTTADSYIVLDLAYEKEEVEKLIQNSGKTVGTALPQEPYPAARDQKKAPLA